MKQLDPRLDLNAPVPPHFAYPVYQLVDMELVEDQRPLTKDPFSYEMVSTILCDEDGIMLGSVLLRYGPLALELTEPNDVFLPAILTGSREIVLTHNHPDGSPDPSEYDIDLTRRVVLLGKFLGIKLRYHNIAIRQPLDSGYTVKIYPDAL